MFNGTLLAGGHTGPGGLTMVVRLWWSGYRGGLWWSDWWPGYRGLSMVAGYRGGLTIR
jgi:hypothetical protein